MTLLALDLRKTNVFPFQNFIFIEYRPRGLSKTRRSLGSFDAYHAIIAINTKFFLTVNTALGARPASYATLVLLTSCECCTLHQFGRQSGIGDLSVLQVVKSTAFHLKTCFVAIAASCVLSNGALRVSGLQPVSAPTDYY